MFGGVRGGEGLTRRCALTLAFLAACGGAPAARDPRPALRLLDSADADDRFEAVVRLGEAAGSPGATEALSRALKDKDDAVRLMPAIALTAAEAGPFRAPPEADARHEAGDSNVTPGLTPNPTKAPAEFLNLQTRGSPGRFCRGCSRRRATGTSGYVRSR